MKKISYLFLSIVLLVISAGVLNAQDVNNPNGYVQVYDISSTLPLNKYSQYYFENDTMIVTFLFWSSQGRLKVRIENKLAEPIYINWSKSMFLVEGKELPLTPYADKLSDDLFKLYEKYKAEEPTLTDMDYEWKNQMATEAEKQKDQIISVMPKSTYTKGNYFLIGAQGIQLDTATTCNIIKHSSEKDMKAYVYTASYTKETSPIKFGITIVYSTDKEVKANVNTFNCNFFVKEINEMDAKHFRGRKIGKTPEGFTVYKFPERASTRFFLEIDRRISVDFNKGRY